MNNSSDIIQQVLSKITPSKKDRENIESALSHFISQVDEEISSLKIKPTITLVGSIAKDTYLKNVLDMDVFLLFSPKISKEIIAKTTLTIGRKLLADAEECYAEHPYIRGMYQNYKFELVPGYKINNVSQKLSAVDRTPLHTTYVKNHLTESQKQEVRLLKQFLRGINCYGAEAEIQGFSGYLCEILIIKFSSFQQFIHTAKNWQPQITLSLQDSSKQSFPEPLVFIDPVDPERNVASAVAPETLDLFIKSSKSFEDEPKITFFFPNKIKPWNIDKIKEEIHSDKKQFIGIIFNKPNLINENLYPQLRRTCRVICNESEQEGFQIDDITFFIDHIAKKIYIIIKTDKKPLSETYTHTGPPLHLKEHFHKFYQKWNQNEIACKQPFEKKGRAYVEVHRKYRNLIPFLSDNLSCFHFGRYVEEEIAEDVKIIQDGELLSEELRIFWTTYLDNKMSWER
jgi:tRNA nucleotidyltransferase (CCA-adding enzyme)